MGSEAPEGMALSLPATRRALRAYRLRAWLVTGAGAAATAVWAALLVSNGGGAASAWSGWAALWAGLGLVALVVGVGSLVLARRMRRVLARHPWVRCACRFRDPADGGGTWGPSLVLLGPGVDGAQHALTVLAMSHRWWHLDKCDGGDVWFAGDPRGGGVVSPPGGTLPLWTRPGRLRASRPARRTAEGTNPAGA